MSFFEFPHTRTYDSDLGWLIKDYKSLDEFIAALKSWVEQTQPTIDELKALYTALMNGNFPDSFVHAMKSWIREYGVDIIAEEIKTVHFGLTNDGYFCAFIPKSWSEVRFDTVTDSDDPLYGHLMLIYD